MIKVFDRVRAEDYLPPVPTIAIRCMSSEQVRADMFRITKQKIIYNPLKGKYVGVLDCVFDDIDPRKDKDTKRVVLFNEDIANRIADFVSCNNGQFQDVMVHCDRGIKRSGGVAVALGNHYNWEYPLYLSDGMNWFVYEVLKEVLERRV